MNRTNIYKPDESGFLTEEGTRSYYSRIGFFCFLLGTVSFLISILASLVVGMFFPWILENGLVMSIFEYALSFVAIYCIATPLAILAIQPLPKVRPIKEKMKFTHLLAALCVCFTFMQVGSYISNILLTVVQLITGNVPTNPVEESLSTGNLLINALLVGIAFPILEEILFRKVLCNKLLPLGEKKAIIISAVIFGFIHGNFYQFAYAFLLGLVFGYIYVKTGKLIYTIIFHCIINLYGGVLAQIVLSNLPIDKVTEILLDEKALTDIDFLIEQLSPYAGGLALYMIYSYLMMGLSIAGFVILLIITVRKKITFEQGILQTPHEHRFANFFLTGGVAAAIGFIAVRFLFSIIP